MNENPERHEAIVIGAGQGGLSASHHLSSRSIDHVVLEAEDRIGDQWRSRYDSLRLYSPAKYDGLPGMPFPLSANAFPTGNQMADYLESYAGRFDLRHRPCVLRGRERRVVQLREVDVARRRVG